VELVTDLDLLIVRLSGGADYTAADLALDKGLFEAAFERLRDEARERGIDVFLLDPLKLSRDEIIESLRGWPSQPNAISTQVQDSIYRNLKERATGLMATTTERAPAPLEPLGDNGKVSVTADADGSVVVMAYGQELGRVGANGEVTGNPEYGALAFEQRCMTAIGEEPLYQSLPAAEQEQVKSAVTSSSSAMLVTGQGCGATFVGYAGDGRAMVVTAAHCDWSNDAEVTFRTVWGRPIRAERVYRSNAGIGDPSDERVWQQGGDLAVYLASAQDTEWLRQNSQPVAISDTPPAAGDMMIAMAPFWQEAELVVQDRTVNFGPIGPMDPSIGTELRVVNMERVRPGYSGSSLLTIDGRLAGITSNGGYDDIANMGVAGFTSWEQLKRVTGWLGLQYPVTQTSVGVQG
jgi:hypothetical protein